MQIDASRSSFLPKWVSNRWNIAFCLFLITKVSKNIHVLSTFVYHNQMWINIQTYNV